MTDKQSQKIDGKNLWDVMKKYVIKEKKKNLNQKNDSSSHNY